MNQPIFMLEIDSEMPEADRDSLLAAMKNEVQIQQQPARQMLPGLLDFIVYAKQVGELASAASSLITLVKEIIQWREAHKAKPGKHHVALKRPGHQPLDIFAATESEIRQWFQP
jgi:hypothetical protein